MLRNSKFDLVFSELFDTCAPGIWKLIGINNFVVVSATGMMPTHYNIIGMPTYASFMPGGLTPYSDKMTFMERLTNLNIELFLQLLGYKIDTWYWKLFNEKYPGFPTLLQLYEERVALIMINVNEFTETPRPTTNMVKYIGGSALRDPKPLTEDLSKLLDKNSVTVLFSMGSLVQSKDMPDWLKRDVTEAFASFPNVTFIWKYESDNYNDEFRKHPNIHPMKWIPQIDLLGLTTLMRTSFTQMHLGKPMIVIPMFADQQLNSKNVIRNGIGIVLERHLLNKQTLTDALRQVIGNREISRKVALVASLLDGRPKQYRQDIARWAKIIIEHGQMDHLKLYSRKLNWIQYYCIDVIVFELSVVVLVISLIIWIVSRIFIYVCAKKLKTD
ncbi:UDP-glucoronosyl and UDP-glucosyl transferase [Oesophagostomum dentatum]|uniref:glucuronosyltransferase n=1 Tax=Oesophagostomum dentatum TaxID=61180 RepID=A0A0B1S455_OESDE|nr:UDP-glucoronosyl and UDP-glucosyl transferase [Oesophagostomum dentatum]